MQDRRKTKQQLIEELASLRAQLDQSKAKAHEEGLRTPAASLNDEKIFAAIFDAFPFGIAVVRKNGAVIYINPAFIRITGYTLPEIDTEKKWFHTAFPEKEYRRKVLSVWVKYLTQHVQLEKVFQVACKNGKIISVEANMISLAEVTLITVLTEVSALGEAEKLVREKEEQWRLLLDTMNEGFITVNEAGIPIFVNQRFCNLLGYRQEEIVGRPLSTFLDEENSFVFQEEFSKRSRGVIHPYEISALRKDGKKIDFLMSPRPLYNSSGHFIGSFGTCMDITERKDMEEELRRSEGKYRSIVENANDAIYMHDLEGNIIDVNENACSMVGYARNELIGANLAKIDPQWAAPDAAVSPDLERLISGGAAVFERRNIRRDETAVPVEVSVRIVSRAGKGLAMAFVRDITDRKAAENALRDREERLSSLARNLPGIVYQFFVRPDGEMGLYYVSDKAKEFLGLDNDPADFYARFLACIPDKDKSRFLSSIRQATLNLRKWEYEGPLITPRGEDKYIRGLSLPEKRLGEVVFNGLVLDITDQKRTEEALSEEMIKVQKLESISTLAGGIAHDFNNLLMGVLGYVGLAKMNIRQELVVARSLHKAEEACLRARELTNRLLTFSRGGDPLMKPIDIKEALRASVKQVLGGAGISCRYYLAKNMPAILADEEQIKQALGNIIRNAVEASPPGGTIHIKGENVPYRRKGIDGRAETPYVRITISDRGKGIPKESLTRLFDPYFTTKEMGFLKGTGLGLPISYSILKKHGGDITVQSEAGRGTAVAVYLPAYGEAPPLKEDGQEGIAAPLLSSKAAKRLLVMDDEEMIRSVMKETLSFLGYDVTTCVEGAEAVKLYRAAEAAGNSYDVVILDLTVPGGMGGQETIRHLLEINPSVRAVIYSGYKDDPVMANYNAYGFKAVWIKPVSMEQMKTTLREFTSDDDA